MAEPTIEIVPLEAFRPDPQNANKGTPRGLGMTENSMRQRGAARSLVATRERQIFIGNHTHEAALNAGFTEAIVVHSDGTRPVIVQRDDLSAGDDETRVLAIEDNRSAQVGLDWNVPVLLEEPDHLVGLFRDDEIAALLASVEEPRVDGAGGDEFDTTPDDGPTRVQYGELWQLGDHRLLCGDSTNAEDVARLMGGERAQAVVTDPPYGMSLDTDYSKMPKTTRGFLPIVGDDRPFDAAPVRAVFADVSEQFWFGADYYARSLGDTEHSGAWLVWDKRVEDRYDSGFGSAFELVWSAQKHKRSILRHQWFQNHAPDAREAGNREHPTQKPVSLLTELVELATERGALVVDPFLGSGTTLIAAQRSGRKCYGMEIEPRYCDVILRRAEAEGISPVQRVG